MKVFLLHNIVAPYRLSLFERLSEEISDLRIFFCHEKPGYRLWDTSLDRYGFRYKILRHIDFRGRIINYTLPWEILCGQFDVLIAFEGGGGYMLSAYLTLILSKILGKPFILCSENIESKYEPRGFGIRARALYRRADVIIVFSEKTRAFIIKAGVEPGRILKAPEVMPKELLSKPSMTKRDTRYRDKKIILSVGYLFKIKGIDYLIRAFKKVKDENAVLIIAGTGPDEAVLKSLAKDEPRIEFAGYVDGAEKSNLYDIADIFVLPSLIDPWGFVINEAMEFGLPVIVTRSAGSSEMIRGNGIVISEANEDELRVAMEKLLANDDLRKIMGERSREIIKDYNVENGVKSFISAITRCSRRK